MPISGSPRLTRVVSAPAGELVRVAGPAAVVTAKPPQLLGAYLRGQEDTFQLQISVCRVHPERTRAGGWVRTALRHKGRSQFHHLVSSVDRSVIGEGSHTRSSPAAWRHCVVGGSRQMEGFGVLSSHGKRSW
ncbi:hypothetical protein chiPu_0030424 [Chiloscyllium punctatum]|uniref:Uncharacterized protein n=1 Tax=Chiloscyllium punctatum TaxID=137246 RepID=A0A401TUD1_CHIPU|nr:hypothetical protein [Chiloscyllium punctatum]